jgi:amidohydrolase
MDESYHAVMEKQDLSRKNFLQKAQILLKHYRQGDKTVMKELLQRAKELEPELLENRRWLHRHPELGFELKETCTFVEEKLKAMGYAPQRMSKAGIVATVGKTGGKTILLRADMDALPMKEESGLDFSAAGNAAHTCGHDTHTAMLLAAAKMLKEREGRLNGCVKLMFQPDEEGTNPLGFSGAQAMLKDGILENPHVDAVVSMHIMSQSPYSAGTVYTRRGPMMSSCDTIAITITGKGTHGSMPQEGVDALNVGVHIYSALQNLTARELAPEEQGVITIGSFNGGEAANVLPEKVCLVGTMRTTVEATRTRFKKRIEAICAGMAQAFGAKAEVEFTQGIPSVYNDPALTQRVMDYTSELLGEKVPEMRTPFSGSDDLSELSQAAPTCYLILSGGTPEEGYPHPQHNPRVTFNESVLYRGAAVFANAAMEWLRENG